MGFDQKGELIFRVKQATTGKWNVMEVGFKKPLASFNNRKDASEYAYDLAAMKTGSRVEIFDEHGVHTNVDVPGITTH